MGFVRLAGVLGFFGVALGAFGAHGLRQRLDPAALAIYQTGVLYHLIHAVAMLAVAVPAAGERLRGGRAACWFFLVGILVFAGSLYGLALTGARWLGAVTPVGGSAFLLGWLSLVIPVRPRT